MISSGSINQIKSRLNNFWKDKATQFEPDCYSYPLRMPTVTSLMKGDKNGPKNREIILGLEYSNIVIRFEFLAVSYLRRSEIVTNSSLS